MQDCCDACNTDDACKAWNFVVDGNTCYLHTATEPVVQQPGHIAGTKGPAPSPVPFPPSVDCQSSPQKDFPFCDSSLHVAARATDLVGRLTLDEKIAQTSTIAPAISRLGINAYNWRSNCVHGWTNGPDPWPGGTTWTVFPNPMAAAAGFNFSALYSAGDVTGVEGRALHNIALQANGGASPEAAGLQCFSPNVNLLRDSLWGRAEETFGGDPYVVSRMGVAYTRGLQEPTQLIPNAPTGILKVGACAKHFAVHNGPDALRETFIANVTTFDLYDAYLPQYEAQARDAAVVQIMPAYSSVRSPGSPDGNPDCANPYLLKTIFREQFGMPNVSVCSDNGGVAMVFTTHHFVKTAEEAAAVSINAGTDLDLGHDDIFPDNLGQAVTDKLVDTTTIDGAVTRSMMLRMRLGDFDPASEVPYQRIGADMLNTQYAQDLNLQIAHDAITMLRNQRGFLPVQSAALKGKTIAVVGPTRDQSALANYAGIPSKVITPLDGFNNWAKANGATVADAPGCFDVVCSNSSGIAAATAAAKAAELTVVFVGLDSTVEGEGHDRAETTCDGASRPRLGLPGCQEQLVEAVAGVTSNVVVVYVHGGPVSSTAAMTAPGVAAVLDTYYNGPLSGQAVVDVITGVVSPGGRLPYTIFNESASFQLDDFENYHIAQGDGFTYRYFNGNASQIQAPFGAGLSYASFQYTNGPKSSMHNPCDQANFTVTLTNTASGFDGVADEVVMAIVQPPGGGKSFPGSANSTATVPFSQTFWFDRVSLARGASTTITVPVDPWSLSVVNDDGDRVILPGLHTISIGGGQAGQSSFSSSNVVVTTWEVAGDGATRAAACPGLTRHCFGCRR